ncbi:NADPH-dependent FMN reductase [Tsukamurella soli]|uniref:NADPH-dependent FMN reductase n=1 Tax=Tsukamurella soli TaxID=644556 RepID=A0ABP8K0V9_9ACTN
MKIGIIIGSVRDGRNGEAVAQWVYKAAEERTDAEFDIVDLKSFNVPILTSATIPGAANKHYDDPAVAAWSKAIDEQDGFVFVTPEYNHGVPGALKNAFDSLGAEWAGKAVAFVSYGADGGIRAVEQWRQIVANFHMVDVRSQVALSLFTDFGPEGLAPIERRAGELTGLLDNLVDATTKVRA